MPPSTSLLAFALVSAAIIVVPGPSVLFIVGRAIAAGRRVALLTVVGNAAGVVVQVVLVALGVGALLERSTTLVRGGPAGRSRLPGVARVARVADRRRRTGRDVDRSWDVGSVPGGRRRHPDRDGPAGRLRRGRRQPQARGVPGGSAAPVLATTPGRLVALRRAGGVVLMGLGGVLALTERTG